MALIKCPECQKEMSDTLEACPHCGFKIKKEELKKPPLPSFTRCEKCGKDYYKGAKTCPYCKAPNTQKPTTQNNKPITFTILNWVYLHKAMSIISIACIVLIILIVNFASNYKYNHPTQGAAYDYEIVLKTEFTYIDSFVANGDFMAVNKEINNILRQDIPVDQNNYFRVFGINDENDKKYFEGTYHSRIRALDPLKVQIESVLETLGAGKDYDKAVVNDERIIAVYPVQLKKVRDKKIREQYREEVRKKIDSFIQYGPSYTYEAKDHIVSGLGLSVTSSESVRNDYGLNIRHNFAGIYTYKGMEFRVTCYIESTKTGGGFNYNVTVEE